MLVDCSSLSSYTYSVLSVTRFHRNNLVDTKDRNKKNVSGKRYNYDIEIMIDCDVAEKRYEKKLECQVDKLYTPWPLITSFSAPPSYYTQ